MAPTPLDHQWLQRQVAGALAETTDAHITLPRPTVELMACVLDQAAGAQPALASRYHISAEQLRPAVLAEIARLAVEGEAPSKSRWDAQRLRSLPTAQHVCRVLAVGWPALVRETGLRMSPYARRFSAETGEVSAEPLEAAEPDPVLTEDDYSDWPVTRSRTEVVTVGNLRITREIHMLR